MAESNSRSGPLFQLHSEVRVAASPADVYAVVTDLGRSAEWSPECQGGQWVSGSPATVGAVFRGENFRGDDIVAWAPITRGDWTTEAQVIEAEPDRVFRWAMRDKTGHCQSSVWGFVVEPAEEGSTLTHDFQMDEPTEGIHHITADMTAPEAGRFFAEWGAKVQGDLAITLERIKEIVEKQ
jgi:Polyketide cyclase / dehydrase and lipid transport